ncbi:MAG: SAM-dependent methyltransferase [Trebonia sp.]
MARVYDFWLGGRDNFAADRAVAEQVAAAYPDVLVAVRAQRALLPGRCTSWSQRRVSGSSWTSGPGCRRRTTPTRSRSGGAGLAGGVRGQ